MPNKLRFAYNTNGCNNHRLYDALDLIAEAGYDGVALTLDWQHLDPFAENWKEQSENLKIKLDTLGLGCVIETGARYLLDPREKHEPTFLNPKQEGRDRRLQFLMRAVDIAEILKAEAVSFWAGVIQQMVNDDDARDYLKTGVTSLAAYAAEKNVLLALEPEPGMLIETLKDLEELNKELAIPLPLALDVGHVWVTGEMEPEHAVEKYAGTSSTAAIEGMNKGVHIHLPVTEGDMNVPKIIKAFQEQEYDKLICVELSRESHRAHKAIFESIAALREMETK